MIIITLPWCYNSAITLMHYLANFCISCVVNNDLGFFFFCMDPSRGGSIFTQNVFYI